MKNKINILTLGDHPLHLSGVAHCLRDICAALLRTGKFTITSLGAAIHHDDGQYFIRGHWRVIALLKNGKQLTLDRHTEKGALTLLYRNLCLWLEE